MLNWLNPFKDIISGLSGVEKVAGVIAAIWSNLTDVHMWASLGWIGVGVAMMFLGILLWLRVPQKVAQVGTSIAGSAAKAAL